MRNPALDIKVEPLPTGKIPPMPEVKPPRRDEHDGCERCRFMDLDEFDYPCVECCQAHSGKPDRYEPANDQSAKQDEGKPQLTLVPAGIITAVEKVRAYGNAKYHSPDNWKQVESQRFWDATVRHIVAAWDDYTAIDPESGLPHIYHAMCNLAFLAERMENENEQS